MVLRPRTKHPPNQPTPPFKHTQNTTHPTRSTHTHHQDPHFKACNHRRRIVQTALLTEYAHLLAPGGWIYTITDVPELGAWMVRRSGVVQRFWAVFAVCAAPAHCS